MRTASRTLADKFHGVVARMLAAQHQQRAIDARRVLHRYRHLLDAEQERSPLNEIISVCNEKEISGHAHRSDEREHAAGSPTLERA
jgi:hypothetical protein